MMMQRVMMVMNMGEQEIHRNDDSAHIKRLCKFEARKNDKSLSVHGRIRCSQESSPWSFTVGKIRYSISVADARTLSTSVNTSHLATTKLWRDCAVTHQNPKHPRKPSRVSPRATPNQLAR
jgi:hypothetical protein